MSMTIISFYSIISDLWFLRWELYLQFGLKIEYIVSSLCIRGRCKFISSQGIRGFLFSQIMVSHLASDSFWCSLIVCCLNYYFCPHALTIISVPYL